MKIMLWEYRTLDLATSVVTGEIMRNLNSLGSEGWEVVLVRDRLIPINGIKQNRLVFLLKRPCGTKDLRV